MYIKFEGKIYIPPVKSITDSEVIDNLDLVITNNYNDSNIVEELNLKWELIGEEGDNLS